MAGNHEQFNRTKNPGCQQNSSGFEKKVGVLALQGGVQEHIQILSRLKNVQPLKIKYPEQLPELDALIIPGGESTTIGKLLQDYDFVKPLCHFKEKGKQIWGTCAGLILVASKIINKKSKSQNKNYNLSLLDITVKRNAYGSQLDSFVTEHKISTISEQKLKLVFIRAPIITSVGPEVKVLAQVKGNIVAAEKGNIMVTSFHPELTNDTTVHQYFVDKII